MAMMAKKIQPAKTAAIEEIQNTLSNYSDFVFTDYRGLTVAQITDLRKKLREKGSEFRVMKNNFVKLAFANLKADGVAPYLVGPTAIALIKEDSNEIAKIMFDFAEEVPALEVKGALIEKEVYDSEKIKAFSKLPGKKQLIAMIASTINAPVQKLAATLQAYVDKRKAEGDAPAPKADEKPAEAAAPAQEPEKPAEQAAEKPAETKAE